MLHFQLLPDLCGTMMVMMEVGACDGVVVDMLKV